MSIDSPTLSVTEGPRPERGPALVRGTTLGRYVVLDLLGSGGMGVVYAAYDFGLDRRVCLKLVRHTGGDRSAERQERLLREARAAARVSHPHVVTVHDVGTWEDHVFVAMELVEGGTLRRWLRAQERTRAEILEVFLQAGRGLSAAHRSGLVHRDFKPDNVLVGADGRVRVTDFGLARSLVLTAGPDAGHTSGTPAYMAPEQHRGDPATAATDQFAFALALYEALFGESPYAASNGDALREAKAQGRFTERPRRARAVPSLHAALLRALSPSPTDRFPSLDALLERLGPDRRRRRWIRLGGATATAGAALGLTFLAAGPRDERQAPRVSEAVTVSTSTGAAQCAVMPAPELPAPVVIVTDGATRAAPSGAAFSAPQPPQTQSTSAPSPAQAWPQTTWSTSTPRSPGRVHTPPASAPAVREEEQEDPRLFELLARLEGVLEELGILEPDDEAAPAFLAAAGVSLAGSQQAQAEYMLGRFGEALALNAPETTQVGAVLPSHRPSAEAVEISRLEEELETETDPVEAAKIRFDLARLLYASDRERALRLASEARAALEALQGSALPDARDLLEEVSGWLDFHKPVISRTRGL